MKIFNVISNYSLVGLLWVVFCVGCANKPRTVTILHTNDTHSQVEPIEEGKRNAGCGGYARRMGLIAEERQKDPNLFLFDAGDFCQGTPFFNFYHGRIEIDALNRMGYDAATLGNHEFDYGLDTLAMILRQAHFPVVCANYDVQDTPLEGLVVPYTVICRGGVRMGVFGIGVNPKGLIAEKNFVPIRYEDPIANAQEMATLLRHKKHCDVVVCLSHQGTHTGTDTQVSDIELAGATRDIDVIIGAHTHQVVENLHIANVDGDSVLLVQEGKSGIYIGKVTIELEE